MMKVSNILMSYVIFGILINLFVGSWAVISDSYNIQENNLIDGKNIGKSIDDLNIVNGMSNLANGLYKLSPVSSQFDLIGGLLLTGLGALQSMASMVTTPIEIMGVITNFYYIPPIIATLFGLVFLIAIAFTYLRIKLGSDI